MIEMSLSDNGFLCSTLCRIHSFSDSIDSFIELIQRLGRGHQGRYVEKMLESSDVSKINYQDEMFR